MSKQTHLVGQLGRMILVMLLGGTLVGCGSGGGSDNILGPIDDDDDDDGGTNTSGVHIGRGVGTNFVEGELAIDNSDLQSGEPTNISVNLVKDDNSQVIDDYRVVFSSACVAEGSAQLDPADIVTAAGFARVEYKPLGCRGRDVITATVTVDDTEITATGAADIAADTIFSIQFLSATKTNLVLKGMAGDDSTDVVFQLTGQSDAPIIGEAVTFSINENNGGAELVVETAESDSEGKVSTTVTAGSRPASIKVSATVTDPETITGRSQDISISTGIPEASRFSVAASDYAPAEAFNTNDIRVKISVDVADQFGNFVPDETIVQFQSLEAGSIGPQCTTVDGQCFVTWRSGDTRPDNMKVSIIAYATGAESFKDRNQNTLYDQGDIDATPPGEESFTDIGEPCADTDDDGVPCSEDIDDFYHELNGNDMRDPGDGEWNGPCRPSETVEPICSDKTLTTIYRALTITMSTNTPLIADYGTFPAPAPDPDTGYRIIDFTSNPPDSGQLTGLLITDSNGNVLPTGTRVEVTNPDEGFQIFSSDSLVSDGQSPTIMRVTVRADDEPTPEGARLLVVVTFPGGDVYSFIWTVFD
jgi:hypothetical protein